MSEENKMREFWIRDFNGEVSKLGKDGFRYGDAEISIWPNCINDYSDFKNAIHVIEMSAYDSLKARHAKLLIELTRIEDVNSSLRENPDKSRNCSYGDWELRRIAREAIEADKQP